MGVGATERPDSLLTWSEEARMGEESLGLGLLLRQSEHAIRHVLQPFLDAEDLLFEHWQVLSVLRARPGLRMSEIADAAVLPPATLTRHMDRLVERALVVRRIDPADKRRVVAALSARGEALASELTEVEREVEAALAKALGADRFRALTHALSEIDSELHSAV